MTRSHTALLLLDLQKGMEQVEAAPYSIKEVVAAAATLLSTAREFGLTTFFVRTGTDSEGGDWPTQSTDTGEPVRIGAEAMEPMDGLAIMPTDIVITKQQWGAFYGTPLELHLRRRGIGTLIMAGFATNFVVEGTAREGWQLGFEQIFVQGAFSSFSEEMHRFSVTNILPLLGHVVELPEAVARIRSGE